MRTNRETKTKHIQPEFSYLSFILSVISFLAAYELVGDRVQDHGCVAGGEECFFFFFFFFLILKRMQP
jgi:hypothetical protein